MAKFKLERQKEESIKNRAIERAAEKVKQKITEEKFRIRPIEEEILKIALNLQQEINQEGLEKQILKRAIEKIITEQGGVFPSKEIEEKYYKIIAEEIAAEISAGEEFHKTIGEKVVELKRNGVYLDGKHLAEEVKKLLG